MRLNNLYILLVIFVFAIAQDEAPEDNFAPEKEKKKWSLFKKKDKSEKEENAVEEEGNEEKEENAVEEEDKEEKEEKRGLFKRKKKKTKFEGGGFFKRIFKKKSEDEEDIDPDLDIIRIPFTPVEVDETIKSSAGDRTQEIISTEKQQTQESQAPSSTSYPAYFLPDSLGSYEELKQITELQLNQQSVPSQFSSSSSSTESSTSDSQTQVIINNSNSSAEDNQVIASSPSQVNTDMKISDEFEGQLLETIIMQNEKIDLILSQLGFSDDELEKLNKEDKSELKTESNSDKTDMLDLLQIVQNKFFELENTVSGSDSLFFDVSLDLKNIQKKMELMNLRLETKIQSLEFTLSMMENEFDDRITQLEIDFVTKDAEVQELRDLNQDVVMRMLKLDELVGMKLLKLENKMSELDNGFEDLKKLNKDLVLNVVSSSTGSSRFTTPEDESVSDKKLRITKTEYKKRYDEAYLKYLDGNYQKALVLFNELLDLENINDLTDNCQYWIGEIHYSLKSYSQAIEAFNKVFGYKSNNKGVYAQYKLGLCYLNNKDTNNAIDAFRKVMANYPRQTDLVKKSESFIEKYK